MRKECLLLKTSGRWSFMLQPYRYLLTIAITMTIFFIGISFFISGDLQLATDSTAIAVFLLLIAPFFLVGGALGEFGWKFLQPFRKWPRYLIGVGMFIALGVLTNVYGLLFLARNGWTSGTYEYLLLGVCAAVLYFHVMLSVQCILEKSTFIIQTIKKTGTKG
jgi:hypothetical protein